VTAPSGGQRWDPERYAKSAGFVPELGLDAVALLAPRPGERILDLGCGEGTLTQLLAEAGAQVVGVDASPEMIEAAQARGLDARMVDGRKLPFEREFDAVFSNAALHWMRDLPAVIGGVRRALKPGGRFVGEMGAEGNVATVQDAIETVLERRGINADRLNPWVFPNADGFHSLLRLRGFRMLHLDSFERPVDLPGDMADWLATFAGAFLSAFDGEERGDVVAEIRAVLSDSLRRDDGTWWVDYVRLRFAAVLEG
jgi:trans-aconitate methyltransferase